MLNEVIIRNWQLKHGSTMTLGLCRLTVDAVKPACQVMSLMLITPSYRDRLMMNVYPAGLTSEGGGAMIRVMGSPPGRSTNATTWSVQFSHWLYSCLSIHYCCHHFYSMLLVLKQSPSSFLVAFWNVNCAICSTTAPMWHFSGLSTEELGDWRER